MSDVSLRIMMSVIGAGLVTQSVEEIAGKLGEQAVGSVAKLAAGFKTLGSGGSAAIDAIKQGAAGLVMPLAALAVAADGVAIGFGIDAVKSAADFNSAMERLVTSAGETQANLQLVSQGILNMSGPVATSTDQLAQGMYYVESAGYHASDALAVLKTAAMGAKSENADLDTVANALTTVMNDYGISASNSSDAMNFLIATVSHGKTTLQDLSSAMSQVLPTASAVQVQLTDVGGAMATMTGEGVDASNAATYLRQLLISLSAPASAGAKSLADIGLTTQEVSDGMKKSLPDTLQMIMQHLAATYTVGSPQYVEALKNIAGGSKQMQGFLDLTGDHLKTFQSNVGAVTGTMNANKGTVAGWAEVSQTLNFRLDQLKQGFNALKISIGEQLQPIASKLINLVGEGVSKFLQWFMASGILQTGIKILTNVLNVIVKVIQNVATWIEHHRTVVEALKVAITGLAIIIGVVLAAGLAIILVGLAALAIAIGVVVGIIAGVIWVVQHWGQIWGAVVGFVKGVWQGFTDWLGNTLKAIGQFFTNIWNDVTTGIKNFFTMIGDWIQARINDIAGFFEGLWHRAVDIWNGLIDGIRNAIQAGFQWVKDRIQDAIQFVVGLFDWLYLHNYYFQALVDTIRAVISNVVSWLRSTWQSIVTWLTNLWHSIVGIATTVWNAVTTTIKNVITAVVGWFRSTWQTVTTWLHNLWQSIVGIATTVWNAVSGAIMGVVNAVWGWLQGVWNTVIGWLSAQWNKLSGFAQTAWNNVVGVFQGVWGSISGTLSDLWNNISNWFGNLGNQALTWGKNVIQMFINGIKNMLGAVGDAAKNVVDTVGKFLGFHSPAKEGPGAEADVWAPNLIKMFAAGLQTQIPLLQTSLALVMRPVAGALSGQGLSPSAVGRGGSSTTYGGNTINLSFNSTVPPTQQQIRQIADWVDQEFGRRTRSQTPSYNQGGVY